MSTESRGGSFYDDRIVCENYLEHRYAGAESPNFVMEEPALLSEIGDPTGLRIIDLGCGDARFGREMLDRGATGYLGIDGSRKMIGRARSVLLGTSGEVRLGDLEDFSASPGSADLVTSRLALHYLSDVRPVIAAMAGCLAPGGRVVITVVHPVITSYELPSSGPRSHWLVDDYFENGPRRRKWLGGEVTWYHRTIEQYVRSFANAGLTIASLAECAPLPDRLDGDASELTRRRRAPLFLLLSGRV